MNALLSALFAVMVIMPSVVVAQDPAAEAPIGTIVADQAVASNAGDGARYASRLAPDASFTNLFGMVMYGAPAFISRHQEILATFYKGTTNNGQWWIEAYHNVDTKPAAAR